MGLAGVSLGRELRALALSYGGCLLGTESSRDQLERADAGSWQIAGRGGIGTSAGPPNSTFRANTPPRMCKSPSGKEGWWVYA